jgi:hypothetical protein
MENLQGVGGGKSGSEGDRFLAGVRFRGPGEIKLYTTMLPAKGSEVKREGAPWNNESKKRESLALLRFDTMACFNQ